MWPHVVGEVALALSLGAVAVAAWSFPRPPERLHRGMEVWLLAVPFVAYAAWLVYAFQQPAPARLQAQLDLLLPAAVVTIPFAVVALATGRSRARSTEEHVAVRLVLLALLAALLVVGLLDVIPQILRGAPLLPRELVAPLLAPLALGCWVAAVLHYRLVEIDAVLRRSLVQGVVAALLGAGFVAAANAVNVAAGTSVTAFVTGGVVALVLVPAAVVLSRAATRLVYGDRAFPSRVVSDLRRLDPGLAPERSLQEVLALLSRRLRLSYASVETVDAPGGDELRASVGERRGVPTVVELEVAGSRVGRLEMEVDPLREPFGPRDRRLLEDVGTQVGALVQALAGTRELQRVRERLVAAREEERRRLRRDLHDGLGPSLATRLMGLEAARDLVDQDPEQAAAILERLADQTQADIGEIRRLVDGLRPAALELGLVRALSERAAQHNSAVASANGAVTWTVVADELGPLPAAVEVAAYRIAVEAVTNAVRHSGGTSCTVTLRRQEGALRVEIRDDGVGAEGGRDTGVGLGSMRDRAEELGGTCTVSAEPGGGTVVVAILPMVEPQPAEQGGREPN
jgi:signal transduction histidine kinase